MNKLLHRIQKIRNLEYILLSIILFLGFVVRLYGINNPIADWHSWRQADTASVSRTYVERGVALLYPKYHDISTIQTGKFNPEGYRFVEFPVYNTIHAVFYQFFSFFSLEVWGRLVSIFSALISAYFLFLLGKKYISVWGGLLASFFYVILPFNIYFTRVILPDPVAVTFALASLWLFANYSEDKSTNKLLLSAVLFALALLIKPFTIFYGVPIAYLAIEKHGIKKVLSYKKYYIAALVAIIPLLLWRYWISKYPEGIPFWKWAFNGSGVRFKPSFWYWIFGERIGKLILGVWGVIPLSFAIMKAKRGKVFVSIFLLGMFLYVATIASANVLHDYYQTMIIPALSLGLAKGSLDMWKLKELNQRMARLVLVISIGLMLIIGAVQAKEFYKINHPEIIEAGQAVDQLVPKDALVIAPYNGDTAFLYQTNRWGWPFKDRKIEELIDKGADYYVSVNFDDITNNLMKAYVIVAKTDNYVIIDLHEQIGEFSE